MFAGCEVLVGWIDVCEGGGMGVWVCEGVCGGRGVQLYIIIIWRESPPKAKDERRRCRDSAKRNRKHLTIVALF